MKKGITPVIAVVLLLLITVGAVGVVYTQFQSIAGGGQTQQKAQDFRDLTNTKMEIAGVRESSSGKLSIYLKNRGDVAINSSRLSLSMAYDGRPEVDPSTAYSVYSDLASSPVSYRIRQGSTDVSVTPYEGTGDGQAFYQGIPSETSPSFAIAIYRDTDDGRDYLIFANRKSDTYASSYAELDVTQIPASAAIDYSDDGNEMDFSSDPEFGWQWWDNAPDGGVVDLGSSWSTVKMEPNNMPSIFHFFEQGDQMTELQNGQELTISKVNNPGCFTTSSNSVVSPGDSYECETGFKMPPPGKELKLTVSMGSSGKRWTHTCIRQTSSEVVC